MRHLMKIALVIDIARAIFIFVQMKGVCESKSHPDGVE